MIDINKGISDLEESFGRRLTDEEKFNIALFGEFMNTFWANTKPKDSNLNPIPQTEEEIKPMDIGEVIDGLDYCLSTGKCIGCANSDGRMVATCRPLVENALRLLKDQNNTISKLAGMLKDLDQRNQELMEDLAMMTSRRRSNERP